MTVQRNWDWIRRIYKRFYFWSFELIVERMERWIDVIFKLMKKQISWFKKNVFFIGKLTVYSDWEKTMIYCCDGRRGMNFFNSSCRIWMPASVHSMILNASSQLKKKYNKKKTIKYRKLKFINEFVTDLSLLNWHILRKFVWQFELVHCFPVPFGS